MIDFIYWLYDSFSGFIILLSERTVTLINSAFGSFSGNYDLMELDFNLTLFSDTPILSTNVYDFLLLVFGIFYTTVFVVIVYKIIKKVLVTITRWNKW